MKIQEAVLIQLLCLFAMLAKGNGRQCYVCFEEKGTSTEGNCTHLNLKTNCEGDELHCFESLRFTKADELFSKRKGCAKECVNGPTPEPPSTGLKERHLFCCTGNLCNTENVTTTVTRNTTQTSRPTPTNSATISGSSLMFVTLMVWSWKLYQII